MSRLLVIVPDRLSSILDKGEIQPDYYNPGRVFDEVDILMTNDEELVSTDFNHNAASSTFDLTQTQVIDGKLGGTWIVACFSLMAMLRFSKAESISSFKSTWSATFSMRPIRDSSSRSRIN